MCLTPIHTNLNNLNSQHRMISNTCVVLLVIPDFDRIIFGILLHRYELMLSCWTIFPEQRPSFMDVVEATSLLLEHASTHVTVTCRATEEASCSVNLQAASVLDISQVSCYVREKTAIETVTCFLAVLTLFHYWIADLSILNGPFEHIMLVSRHCTYQLISSRLCWTTPLPLSRNLTPLC